MIQAEPRATLKAAQITEVGTLRPVTGRPQGPIVLMLAAEFGGVPLSDQREVLS